MHFVIVCHAYCKGEIMAAVELRDVVLFCTPLGASVVSLGLLHWFPWKGGVDVLERTTAYALGTIVTVGFPAATMLLAAALAMHKSEVFWACLLLVNALISGATVNLAYWIDSKRPITLDEAARDVSN
jgi:hypothetical protein